MKLGLRVMTVVLVSMRWAHDRTRSRRARPRERIARLMPRGSSA